MAHRLQSMRALWLWARAYFLCHIWDLSYQSRDRTHTHCIARWILNPCTTRKVPVAIILLCMCVGVIGTSYYNLCHLTRGCSFRKFIAQFSLVQLLSRIRLFATPCTAARQASLSISNSSPVQSVVKQVKELACMCLPSFLSTWLVPLLQGMLSDGH